MEFSGIVKITDLNDFIRPAENCSVHSNMIKKSAQNTAKVSLSDCLSCSGCITSAESILLEQQSISTLQEKLSEGLPIAFSISQQSLLSLASSLGLSLNELQSKVYSTLLSKGISEVYEMCESRDIILESSYQEFKSRYLNKLTPVLSSECPGWLCYALKKGDSNLLPLMSCVKTPMLVQKSLKSIQCYHVAVLPCYDKKLESFMEPGVDLVLTTNELLSFCGELVEGSLVLPEFYSSVAVKSSSFGYAEYVLQRFAHEFSGVKIQPEFKSTRRRDVFEAEYNGIWFCIVSGFQNIQNLLREIKNKRCKYHYVEIMACPMGCLNGGGQLPTTREKVQETEINTQNYYKDVGEINVVIDTSRELKLVEGNKLNW